MLCGGGGGREEREEREERERERRERERGGLAGVPGLGRRCYGFGLRGGRLRGRPVGDLHGLFFPLLVVFFIFPDGIQLGWRRKTHAPRLHGFALLFLPFLAGWCVWVDVAKGAAAPAFAIVERFGVQLQDLHHDGTKRRAVLSWPR